MKKKLSLVLALSINFLVSTSQLVNTLPPNAATLSNSNQYAATPKGMCNNSRIFTLEFWVNTNESRTNAIYWQRPCLLGNITSGLSSGDLCITINNGYIGMWEGLSLKNTDQEFTSPYVRINDNLWHHIAVVNNGQTISLFVDGNNVGTLASGKFLLTDRAPLTFGAASLDFSWPGNSAAQTNFPASAIFADARFSGNIRYTTNFTPSQSLNSDLNTIALYHFADQSANNNSSTYNNPPTPPINSYPANNNYSYDNDQFVRDGVIYFNDTALTGRLTFGKKAYSNSNEIFVHFAEGNSRNYRYYRAGEIRGFQIGDHFFESKYVIAPSINAPLQKTFVERLTQFDSKISMYSYEYQSSSKNANGIVEYKNEKIILIQLPGSIDDKVYSFSDNHFVPHFDEKVSALVQSKPALAEKIMHKEKGYFYAAFSEEHHRMTVWWNIINEFNAP